MAAAEPLAEPGTVAHAIRTPKAAAIAGILFSVIFSVALMLVRASVPADPADAGEWLTDSTRRTAVLTALGLTAGAGIVFLWEVGVLRDHVGAAEDRFLATVFLGSAILFVGMICVASALAAGLITAAEDYSDELVASGIWTFARQTVYWLMIEYGMRMAGVFTLITTMILLRAKLAPRWLLILGFATAFVLMVVVSFLAWAELAFRVDARPEPLRARPQSQAAHPTRRPQRVTDSEVTPTTTTTHFRTRNIRWTPLNWPRPAYDRTGGRRST